MSLKDLIGTPLEIEALRENQQLREQNRQLSKRNARLVAVLTAALDHCTLYGNASDALIDDIREALAQQSTEKS